jgi:hypothetical protein
MIIYDQKSFIICSQKLIIIVIIVTINYYYLLKFSLIITFISLMYFRSRIPIKIILK